MFYGSLVSEISSTVLQYSARELSYFYQILVPGPRIPLFCFSFVLSHSRFSAIQNSFNSHPFGIPSVLYLPSNISHLPHLDLPSNLSPACPPIFNFSEVLLFAKFRPSEFPRNAVLTFSVECSPGWFLSFALTSPPLLPLVRRESKRLAPRGVARRYYHEFT